MLRCQAASADHVCLIMWLIHLCTAPLLKSTTIVYMPKGKTIAGLSPASRQAISGPAMATAASRLSRYTGKAYRSKQAIGASQCTFDRSSHPEAARVCYG